PVKYDEPYLKLESDTRGHDGDVIVFQVIGGTTAEGRPVLALEAVDLRAGVDIKHLLRAPDIACTDYGAHVAHLVPILGDTPVHVEGMLATGAVAQFHIAELGQFRAVVREVGGLGRFTRLLYPVDGGEGDVGPVIGKPGDRTTVIAHIGSTGRVRAFQVSFREGVADADQRSATRRAQA